MDVVISLRRIKLERIRVGHLLDQIVIGFKGNSIAHVAIIQTKNIDTCIHMQMFDCMYVCVCASSSED